MAVAYDCMDELSAFKNAPEELHTREAELFGLADLVFTGGRSLYEVKREQHEAVYCFPSSIDVKHFAQALDATVEPSDQAEIARPRIGFFGVTIPTAGVAYVDEFQDPIETARELTAELRAQDDLFPAILDSVRAVLSGIGNRESGIGGRSLRARERVPGNGQAEHRGPAGSREAGTLRGVETG